MNIKSLRFNPFWKENSNYQKEGLIDLINFIKDKNDKLSTWLEVGSYIGESAQIFLSFEFIKELTCIDLWTKLSENTQYLELDRTLIKKIFYDSLDKEIKSGRCVPIEGDSIEIFKKINKKFDVIYLDANHSYKGVTTDLVCWYINLNIGGYMCGHDYLFDKNDSLYTCAQGVRDFLNALTPYNGTYEFHVFKDGSWLFKKEEDIKLNEYIKKMENFIKK